MTIRANAIDPTFGDGVPRVAVGVDGAPFAPENHSASEGRSGAYEDEGQSATPLEQAREKRDETEEPEGRVGAADLEDGDVTGHGMAMAPCYKSPDRCDRIATSWGRRGGPGSGR